MRRGGMRKNKKDEKIRKRMRRKQNKKKNEWGKNKRELTDERCERKKQIMWRKVIMIINNKEEKNERRIRKE